MAEEKAPEKTIGARTKVFFTHCFGRISRIMAGIEIFEFILVIIGWLNSIGNANEACHTLYSFCHIGDYRQPYSSRNSLSIVSWNLPIGS
ncbi:hypothetical protein IFVP408_C120166 [Vibrio parahaemolyticus]